MPGGNYPDKRPHAYDTYVSSVDWTERVISEGASENSKQWLLTDLAEFLSSDYNISNSPPNKLAMWKAVELMDGYKREIPDNVMSADPVVRDKSERERKLIFKKLVKEAHEEGYLENFRLVEPWHPAAFLSGEFVSYPYQHNTAIVYRGITRDNYYVKDQKPKDKGGSMRNPISILDQGYLNPGNSFNDNGKNAVWTTPFLQTAQGYGSRHVDRNSGIVLEIQAPTKWVQCGAHRSRTTHNLEEIQEEFGSPKNYRKHVQGAEEDASLLIRPKLPIKYVTGVWDLQFFDEPYFIPLQSQNTVDAIDLAYRYQEEKLPDNPKFGRPGFQEETEEFIEMSKLENRLEEDVRFMVNIIERDLDRIKKLNLGIEKRYAGDSEFRPIDLERVLEKLISSIDGDDENKRRTLNSVVEDIYKVSAEIGVSNTINTVKVTSFRELHEATANILKGARELERTVQEINIELENKDFNEEILERFSQVLDDLYRIRIDREAVVESAEESTAELRNEILSIESRIKDDFKMVRLMRKMESRLKEAIQAIEVVRNHGRMGKRQLFDIQNSMNQYEATGDKELGVNEILRIGRKKLSIPKEVDPPVAESLPNLEKALKQHLKAVQDKKSELNQIEKEFENIIEEIERIKDNSSSGKYPPETKEELNRIISEHERLTSQGSLLYELYSSIEGVTWDYRKFKSQVKSQSATA